MMMNQCQEEEDDDDDDDDDQGLIVVGFLMMMMKTVMMGSTTHLQILAIFDLGFPKTEGFHSQRVSICSDWKLHAIQLEKDIYAFGFLFNHTGGNWM